MKALTNILNYILLLMMILIASCTEDVAEVDNLVRGEEYVQVRMQVPGMKAAATRADDGVIESITALVYRGGVLNKIETAIELTTTNFKMPKPQKDDVIHFLANLPDNYSLPEIGTEESALCNLTTNHQTLCYWGKYTYNDEAVINTLTLYRNMAMITIAPDPNDECTFPEDELFIVGLVNANQSGALVPYNGSFNFDLTTNDYFTLPADVEKATDTELSPAVTSLYVFEHDNPDAYTEASKDSFFCVICKIGKYYYKVALTSDGETPYDIIRNHKYTILVNDLDEGEPDYDAALTANPINLEIKVEKEVALQLIQEGIDENGDELKIQQGNIDINSHANSTEEVTIKVVVPAGVKTLTVQADGFTVTSGDAGDGREMTSDGNNQYTIKEAYRNQENIVRFKLKLNDDVDAETATTITVSGEGEDQYTTVTANASTTITVTPASETEGTIWWQGEMVLDATDDETKIAIPKSYFFNGETPLIPVGSQIVFDFENVTGFLSNTDDDYRRIWMQAADPRDWSQVASQDFVYDGNRATLNVTQDVLNDILDTSNDALMIQGQGRILKKITLIRAKESIIATADKTQLYYDSDDTQVVTINVTVPDGVERLNIDGASNFTVKQGDNTLTATEGVYSYTVTDNSNPIPFTFTLNPQNVTETQTITFSDPTESVNSAEVAITMAATPTVTFSPTGAQTLYWNNDSPTTLQVQMSGTSVPNDKKVTLTITAADFTITAENETELTQNDNVWTYTGTLTNLIFTPTSSGEGKSINIAGEGVDVNVTSADITVNVDATSLAVTPTATINMDNSETSTTLTLTKPGNITNLKVTASNNNAFSINGNAINGDYYIGGLSSNNATIDYTIALQDGFDTAGEYTITFTDNGGGGQTVTATITIVNTPSLQFEYENNTTLYLDSGDGNPTTLPVTITVPEGSTLTELNISAIGLTVTSTAEGLTESEGSYTYTGGSTTFTFTPTTTGDKTITFTGSGTNLKEINETINVKVEAAMSSEIVLWQGSQSVSSSTPAHLNFNNLDSVVVNATIYFDFTCVSPADYWQLRFMGWNWNDLSPKTQNFQGTETGYKFVLTTDDVTKIKDEQALGVFLTGNGLTVTKIYIK